MHSAVLQNKKYVAFAKKHTVEVIALGSLDKGIQNGDAKAGTYKGKDEYGDDTEYLNNWPGLTVADVNHLAQSKARTYNKTGKIPYTSIVDPHTLEEIEGWLGGQSAKRIIDAATKVRRKLRKDHGDGVSRKDLDGIDESISAAREHANKMQFGKAVAALGKSSAIASTLPKPIQEKINSALKSVLKKAETEIRTFESLARVNPTRVKRELSKLKKNFKGTGFEKRVAKILENVSS